MAMTDARRPTTRPFASITNHFFSMSAVLSVKVDMCRLKIRCRSDGFKMTRRPEESSGRRVAALLHEASGRVNHLNRECRPNCLFRSMFYNNGNLIPHENQLK